MRRAQVFGILGCLAVQGSGCGFLADLVGSGVTEVQLVNNGDFDVEGTLYFDDEQDIPREALTEFGRAMDFTVAPGETMTFSRDCDELQAIVIDDADLMVAGQIGPEADTGVQRDGDDFGCGDTIVFTFDHGPLFVDFAISVAVESR